MKKLLLRCEDEGHVYHLDRVDVNGVKWPLKMLLTVKLGPRKIENVVTFKRTGQWEEQRRLYVPATAMDTVKIMQWWSERQEATNGNADGDAGRVDGARVDRVRGGAARNPWA